MAHIVDIHINDTLEHHADDMHMRAMILQSHLESTAAALSHVKSIYNSKMGPESQEDEDDLADQVFRRIDSLVSQTRSAKVVSSKTARGLEDLKSRHITLDPSTANTVEQAEQSGADLCSAAVRMGHSTFELFAQDDSNETTSVMALTTALQSGQSSLSLIASKLQIATSHLQAFYNLTTNLSQAVEFPVPSSNPPWKLLAQHMKAANADLAAREVEMSQLKDEVVEKNTALAIKEKIAEEMGVKLEVLEKRVGESSGRRERIKELEEASVLAKAQEKDLLQKLTRLQSESQKAEAEREKREASMPAKTVSIDPGQPPMAGISSQAEISQSTLLRISSLEAEIKSLQSCIRYLRNANFSRNVSDSLDFLSTTVAPVPPRASRVATEAKGVLKEMLSLVAGPNNQPVKLQSLPATERVRWRPARNTTAWQVRRQREEWEEWREWRVDVAEKAASARRQREKVAAFKTADKLIQPVQLSSLQTQLPVISGRGGTTKNVEIPEWEDTQHISAGAVAVAQ